MLWRLARDSGLDRARFQQDFTNGEAYQEVLHDYAEGVAWFGVSALPAVIFNEKVSLVGAVPQEQYRVLLDWIIAGETGGLIPLDFGPPDRGAAGQSPVR
ncbi:MAG: DsbA family oxidoreductase [Candidatus Entotheonellia bacterium]